MPSIALLCLGLGGCLSSWDDWGAIHTGNPPEVGVYECPEGRSNGSTDTQQGRAFNYVCAGTFMMGSPQEEEDRDSDEVQHEVTLTGGYWIGKYEITQLVFEDRIGYQPSSYDGCSGCPVETVSWHEATAFANALSDDAGLDRCYDCTENGSSVECNLDDEFSSPYVCPGYRLPTEAEWEMAARGGESWIYAGSDDLDEVAWYGENTDKPQQVGSLQPNAWGLHDMSGNVWEWCHDCNDDYPTSAVVDPFCHGTGSSRVTRGGSWYNTADLVRVAKRGGSGSSNRYGHTGFRLVRSDP